jgi:hypothetical protein
VSERTEYATAKDTDVNILLRAFERGQSFTKDQAKNELGIPDRRFRAAVAQLREQGEPIVSWSEEGSVYRMARDAEEAHRFVDTELVPRIRHLERQARHIRIGIPVRFKISQGTLL